MWTYDTGDDGPKAEFHGHPVIVGKTVVLPTDAEPSSHVYAFDPNTGDVRWRVKFEGGVVTTPILAGRSLILASATGKVARVDLDSGKAAWTVAPDGERPVLPYIVSPAADSKRVYFASNDAKLFAIHAANGETAWKKDIAARINTSLQVHNNALYAGATDRHLYVVDPVSGDIRQRIAMDGSPYGTLVVAPPLLIALVKAKPAKLVAFDMTTNKVRWERTTEREWTTMKPLIHDGMVIAGTEEKELCAFRLADGEVRWCTQVPQVPRGLGTSDGMLYVGTLNGRVLAYQLPK